MCKSLNLPLTSVKTDVLYIYNGYKPQAIAGCPLSLLDVLHRAFLFRALKLRLHYVMSCGRQSKSMESEPK